MRRAVAGRWIGVGLSAMVWAGCSEAGDPPEPSSEGSVAAQVTTHAQAVVDQGAPNWFIAGASGGAELVGGTDGEPDVLAGRFVLEGGPVYAAAAGDQRFIVAGDGQVQALDASGLRLADARAVLNGEPVYFITPAAAGWLIGGGDGRALLLDAFGEPTSTATQLFSGDALRFATWNGLSWIVATATQVTTATAQLTSSASAVQTLSAVDEIRGLTVVEEFGGSSAARVYAFGRDTAVRLAASGAPLSATQIEAGLEITTVHYVDARTMIGTSDGRVGFFDASGETVGAWTSVVAGQAVQRIEWNGQEYLVLGAEGALQRVAADGTVLGAELQLPVQGALSGAWFADGGWSVVLGESGLVLRLDAAAQPIRALTPRLEGQDVLAAQAWEQGVIVVGRGGAVQMLDASGQPGSSVQRSANGSDLHGISYNGTVFLAVGDGGFGQFVSTDGAFMGQALNLLGGGDVDFATWSGETWLVGGAAEVQRIRATGEPASEPLTVPGMASIHDAAWSGSRWGIVGTSEAGNAAFALIARDGSLHLPAFEIASFPGSAFAIEFTGSEFVVGGTDGLIQRISVEGSPVDEPLDVLFGYDVHDVTFNGVNYMVGGELGAVRRLSPMLQPLRAPLATLDLGSVEAVVWTRPRGFAGGVCLTETSCYEGPCVGGIEQGKCCDSSCERACESCFARDTGEPDGTCAPVVAGKQAPTKPGQTSSGCTRQSELTCGLTGVCDGAGECAFYGAEVTCGESICSNGSFFPVSSCDSAGACAEPTPVDCAPYIGCTIDNGCQTACAADTDCVEGYICDRGAEECVVEGTETSEARPAGASTEDEGGCSATGASSPGSAVLIGLLLGILGLRRRS